MTLTAPFLPTPNVGPLPNPQAFADLNTVFTLSGQIIQSAEQYVTTLAENGSFVAPVINVDFPKLATAPNPNIPNFPELIGLNFPNAGITWEMPTAPQPNIPPINVSTDLPGPYNGPGAPDVSYPAIPVRDYGQAPPAPGLDLNFTYPTINVTFPNVPNLLAINTIQFNPLVIPTFEINPPILLVLAPSPIPYVEEAFYTSPELTLVQTSLSDAINSGTDTGLDAATQQAIWNAAYEREYRAQFNALEELERMEQLGYAFPPGVFINARLKIQTETAYTIGGLSRDIMVKQAEMHLENVIKARELAVSLEGKLIDYYNEIANRSLAAAKYITDAAVAIYNGQVAAYAATIEGFKAQVMAYDTQIKGIQAYVDQLTAQIAFEKTKAEINVALANIYKTEADVAVSQIEIYKLQVEIIQTEANIQKIKVDIFSAEIQAYVGEINGYAAEVEAYKAVVETSQVKANIYKTDVDAYAAGVTAGAAKANAYIEQQKNQVAIYEAQLDAFKATLQTLVAEAQAANAFNLANVEAYKGEVAGLLGYNAALEKEWQAIIDENLQVTQVALKQAEVNVQSFISERQIATDANKVAAQVMAQLGAAALNAIHWSNQQSWSSSISNSGSTVNSASTNMNNNLSESASV